MGVAVKKQVKVNFIKLTQDSIFECLKFTGDIAGDLDKDSDTAKMFCSWAKDENGIPIKTLEGTMLASFGDYIIEGVSGEKYPCKPDIFAKTYDILEE